MTQADWHIGDVVRKLREQIGMNGTRFGQFVGGMNKATVSRLEKFGELRSSPETIQRIAATLKLEVRDLYAMVPRYGTELPREYAPTEATEIMVLRVWRAAPPKNRALGLGVLQRVPAQRLGTGAQGATASHATGPTASHTPQPQPKIRPKRAAHGR